MDPADLMTLQQRIERLSAVQRRLLVDRLLRQPASGLTAGTAQLLAYVVSGPHEAAPAELRRFLAQRLPAYLVPSRVIPLSALPLLPNGKVDRHALASKAVEERPPGGVGPTTATHPPAPELQRLLEIWREMLGQPGLSEEDDFFEAGGDSILAIQLVARAAREGFGITLGEFFRGPTVSQMAAAARANARPIRRPSATGTGVTRERAVPLTPIQHWFFEQDFSDPGIWNQAQALEMPGDTDHGVLEEALYAVMLQHDALRLALVRKAGGWQQHVKALRQRPVVPCVGLPASSEEDLAIQREMEKIHASIRLDAGVMLRAVRFSSGQGRDRLYLVAHHLAVDAVSWRILIDDLEAAYRDLRQQKPVAWERRAASFGQWSDALHAYAQSDTIRQELGWWTAQPFDRVRALARELPGSGGNDEGSCDVVVERAGAQETLRLLERAVPTLRADVSELVLAALIRMLAAWSGHTTLLVGVEGHGRGEILEDLDVSRTVGWLTAYYPVVFDTGGSLDYVDVLRRVKEQVRAVPGRGVGYGALRYLTPDAGVTEALATQPAPEVVFNYLGHERAAPPSPTQFLRIPHGFSQKRAPLARRPSVFEVNARIAGDRLEIICGFSRNLHRRDTMETLVRGMIGCLVSVCEGDPSSHAALTPSDFPHAGLDQSDLDSLVDRIR